MAMQRLMSLLQTLQADQLPIPPSLYHQLMMGTTLDDDTFINHINDIGLLDRA